MSRIKEFKFPTSFPTSTLLIIFPTQVFAFVLKCDASVWGKFDWTKLTTVAVANFYDAELMCHAHQQGVRVVKLGMAKNCTLSYVQRKVNLLI